ncbi:uncharacterized protein LOC122267199 [Penaeus japonicus]|uniref:uncharacterized protein LOC122267199 n=1 Tax=Penaeus japonicus TaxID=27405 RepID=UPI001C713393|nr:uncharacterized protein LOC122267199 [Penaeus japonicus]
MSSSYYEAQLSASPIHCKWDKAAFSERRTERCSGKNRCAIRVLFNIAYHCLPLVSSLSPPVRASVVARGYKFSSFWNGCGEKLHCRRESASGVFIGQAGKKLGVKMRKFILLLAMVIIMAIGSVDSMNWGNQCREAGGNCVVLRKASPACKKYREVNDCRGTRSCCPEKFRIVGKDTSEEDSEKRPMKQRKKVGRKVQRPVTRQRCGTTDACSEKGGKCKKRCRKNSDPSLCDNNCVCCGICQAKPKCDSFEGVCRRSCSATERVIKGGCKKKKKCTCCAKQCEQNDCLGTCVSKKRECNGIFVKNGCGGKQCHCCNPVGKLCAMPG